MAMERWNPFREMLTLREAMDRLFEESFVRPGSALSRGAQGSFPMDMAETEDGFVVRASLPGIKPEDVQVTVHGDLLTIRGESKTEQEEKGRNWIVREHRAGTFQRSVNLPAPVDADRAEAHYEHGVLQLTLPKAEAGRPRQIKVGGGSQLPGAAPAGSPGPARAAEGTAADRPDESGKDKVEEGSEESFPASDAPSWTPERA